MREKIAPVHRGSFIGQLVVACAANQTATLNIVSHLLMVLMLKRFTFANIILIKKEKSLVIEA